MRLPKINLLTMLVPFVLVIFPVVGLVIIAILLIRRYVDVDDFMPARTLVTTNAYDPNEDETTVHDEVWQSVYGVGLEDFGRASTVLWGDPTPPSQAELDEFEKKLAQMRWGKL